MLTAGYSLLPEARLQIGHSLVDQAFNNYNVGLQTLVAVTLDVIVRFRIPEAKQA